MKIRHRVPTLALRSDPMSPEYEAEVQRCTESGQRAYEAAERRLRKAEARHERLAAQHARRPSKSSASSLADAWAAVELRRLELEKYARMAAASPQSAQHRGRKSFRPVPAQASAL